MNRATICVLAWAIGGAFAGAIVGISTGDALWGTVLTLGGASLATEIGAKILKT